MITITVDRNALGQLLESATARADDLVANANVLDESHDEDLLGEAANQRKLAAFIRECVVDVTAAVADKPATDPRDAGYRAGAKQLYEREGEVEIDDTAPVSYADDSGAYVQAWVWVYEVDAHE